MSREAELWIALADVQSELAQVTSETTDEDYGRMIARLFEVMNELHKIREQR